MTIFNIQIWGDDADRFMALSCEQKKVYIKKHTNQQNDELIKQFIKTALRGNYDECHGCKEAKKVNNGNNISTTIQQEVANVDTVGKGAPNGKGNDAKGRGATRQANKGK